MLWYSADPLETGSPSKEEEQGYDAVLEYLREKQAIGLLHTLNFEVVNGTGYTAFEATVGAYFEVIWPGMRAMAVSYGLNAVHTVQEDCAEIGEWVDAASQLMCSSLEVLIVVWLRPYFCWKRKLC